LPDQSPTNNPLTFAGFWFTMTSGVVFLASFDEHRGLFG
jgi:hypothetical protein